MYRQMIMYSSHLRINMNMFKLSVNRSCSSLVNQKYYDVIIAGGGMVGCAMACKLSNEPVLRGISILLLEGAARKKYNLSLKKNVPNKSYSNRVSAINKSSVQLLQSFGAWQNIKDIEGCNAVNEMRIWNCGGGNNGGLNNMLTFNNDNDLAYIVENDIILGTLYEQIHNDKNITLHYDSRVTECSLPESHTGLATVKVANNETMFETSLLIGSDGYGSKVRSAISGQQYISWEYGQYAVVATLHVQPNEDDIYKGHVAWQKFAQLGPVALLPLDNQTYSLVWTTSFEEATRLVGLNDNEFIKALNDVLAEENEANNSGSILANDATSLVSIVLNKVFQSNENNVQHTKVKCVPPIVTRVTQGSLASFPLGFGHACQYVDRRGALVGDAAHRIHPLAGQGVNLGFSDVEKLSNKLNNSVLSGVDIGDFNILLDYQTAAQRHNIPIMLGIDGIQKIYACNNNLVPSAITTLVRNIGLAFCQSTSLIKKLLSDKASGLPI